MCETLNTEAPPHNFSFDDQPISFSRRSLNTVVVFCYPLYVLRFATVIWLRFRKVICKVLANLYASYQLMLLSPTATWCCGQILNYWNLCDAIVYNLDSGSSFGGIRCFIFLTVVGWTRTNLYLPSLEHLTVERQQANKIQLKKISNYFRQININCLNEPSKAYTNLFYRRAESLCTVEEPRRRFSYAVHNFDEDDNMISEM